MNLVQFSHPSIYLGKAESEISSGLHATDILKFFGDPAFSPYLLLLQFTCPPAGCSLFHLRAGRGIPAKAFLLF